MESLSVGYESVRDLVLERAIQLGTEKRLSPLFVRGEWGTGKSHFTKFVRAIAHELGVASALVDLNARGHALNYPQRFYPAIAETCRISGVSVGLKQIIASYLRTGAGLDSLKSFATSHTGEVAEAIRFLCWDHESDDAFPELSAGEHLAWNKLLGGDIAWASYAYKRPVALRRIADLASLFRVLGARGLVLIFDEVETIDQLWNIRSRLSAYSTLGEFAAMPNVWCVFTVTARFDAVIRADLDAGITSNAPLSGEAKRFLRSFDDGRFDSVSPPGIDGKGAMELAHRIERLYRRAHPSSSPSQQSLSPTVERWARDPRRNPRTLIRTVIDQLDRLHPLIVHPSAGNVAT
jgi:hypothetical protein